MKNLAKAVLAVMKEVKGMEKNSRVGSGGSAYNGTKDQDVKEVFNEALANNGLCIMPIDIQESTEVSRWEEVDQWSKSVPKDMKSKQSIFTKVNVKYLLLHESGESQTIAGYGHGVDPQDKGAGKATTYALKNALLYTFLTPVGKMDDTETTHSNDMPTAQPVKPKPVEVQKSKLTDIRFTAAVEKIEKGEYTAGNLRTGFDLTKEQKKLLEELEAFIAEVPKK